MSGSHVTWRFLITWPFVWFLASSLFKTNPFLARGTPLPYALMIQDDGNQLVRAPLGLIRATS